MPEQALVSPELAYVIFFANAFLFILIGYIVYKRQPRTLEQYLVAGRRVKWPMIAGSLIVTWVWASTVLASGEMAFAFGWPGLWIYPISGISIVLLIPIFTRVRKALPHGITWLEYVRHRCGREVHLLTTIISLTIYVVLLVYLYLGLGWGMSAILGMPFWQCVFLGGIIIILYTVLGGLWGEILTDYIQFILVWLVTLAALAYSLAAIGGFSGLYQGLVAKGVTKGYSIITVDAFFGLLLPMISWFTYAMLDQTIWQRMYALDKDEDLKKMCVTAFIGWALYPMVAGMVGLIGLHQGLPLELASDVFPVILMRFAPVWTIPFVFLIFSAIGSTLDSMLIGISGVFITDVYKPYIAKEAISEEKATKFSRIIVVVAGIIGMLLSLEPTSILFLGMYLGGFYIALTAPLILTFVLPRVNRKAVFLAQIVGYIIQITLGTFIVRGEWPTIAGYPAVWPVWILLYALTTAITVIGSKISPGPKVELSDIARMAAEEAPRGS